MDYAFVVGAAAGMESPVKP